MFFANDMVLFSEALVVQAKEIIECLNIFCTHSGQKVNVQKSWVFFSKNTPTAIQQQIVDCTGFSQVENMGSYLGIPSIHGMIKRDTFAGLIEKIHRRLAGWKSKTLPLAGRQILAQSVLTAIPYYSMKTTLLPLGV